MKFMTPARLYMAGLATAMKNKVTNTSPPMAPSSGRRTNAVSGEIRFSLSSPVGGAFVGVEFRVVTAFISF
ncbi:MAG: hypothetical protein ACD_23C00928G0002 [uncultured bacterium]|nr:MAG: hypothetical protein ACD_23C00928G0002 [uncultured bacterium]